MVSETKRERFQRTKDVIITNHVLAAKHKIHTHTHTDEKEAGASRSLPSLSLSCSPLELEQS